MAPISKLMSLLKSTDFKDVIGNNGCIAPPSCNLYKQLSIALDHLISPKYIYTILKLNRYNIYKDLLLIIKKLNYQMANYVHTYIYIKLLHKLVKIQLAFFK